MIDIIIPAYNAHKTIEKTLYSIAYQDIINNINVYVINDSSNEDYSKIIKHFKHFMKIKEIKLKKNSGPGVARKTGIINSNSKYIMFIDSDDVLYDCFSVKRLYDCIENTNADVVIGNFYEECDDYIYEHNEDNIWLHGKIYRRKFLEANEINFNNSRLNEDNGFNQLVFLCNSKVYYINNYVYIWCNNKNSITRKDNHSAMYELLLGYIYNITWSLENAIKRNCDQNKIANLSFISLMAIYSHYLSFKEKNKQKEILEQSKKIKKILDKYEISNEKKIELLSVQFDSLYNGDSRNDILNAEITFKEFLKLVDEVKE